MMMVVYGDDELSNSLTAEMVSLLLYLLKV